MFKQTSTTKSFFIKYRENTCHFKNIDISLQRKNAMAR